VTAPEPEPSSGTYLDDAGQLRDPAGNVVDPTSEGWWSASWADDAAKLLGPDWMVGPQRRRGVVGDGDGLPVIRCEARWDPNEPRSGRYA
jgi:hypothetical protein